MEELPDTLDNVSVVLWEPQDDINIGNAVRGCKNFGVTDLRLVRPAEADPDDIAISAPKASDVIDNIRTFSSLEEAVSDAVYVVATTARRRAARRITTEPRGAAAAAVDAAREGTAAFVFGREDSGLPNEALDKAHSVVTIPTNPEYSSLNLGQAVLLNVWEVFRAATDAPVERPDLDFISSDGEPPPATMEDLERMFHFAKRALREIGFFNVESTWHIMRTVRSIFMRASLDEREVSMWTGIFSNVVDAAGEGNPDED